MNYGICYKGSKSKLAEAIVSFFPKRQNFYDLFCGGCAITHRALLVNKFENIYINDINPMCSELFMDAIHGKFKNENRWISREDFFNSNEPYVKFCWSFGINLVDYLYSREIEPIKRAWHYALFFNDFSLMKEFNIDLSSLANEKNLKTKYLKSKRLIKEQHLQSLEALDRLKRLQSLESLKSLKRLQISSKSYDEVDIKPNSVIYCDIPYQNTNKYKAVEEFEYKKFYDWCSKQTEPLYISSYNLPEDKFVCITDFKHSSNLCATKTFTVLEKIYMPIHQVQMLGIHKETLF